MAVRSGPVVAGACGFAALCGSAAASISGSAGDVQVIAPPADTSPNALVSPIYIRAWNERQNVLLDADLRVDGVASGLYDGEEDLGVHFIPGGTRVSSHYVHFDTPGTDFGSSSGSVTFSDNILGVIVLGDSHEDPHPSLDLSDFLGAPATIYPDHVYHRGTEMGNDRFSISADRKTLTIGALYVIAPGDSIRVVTAVPAPGAAALATWGIAAIGRRRIGRSG